MRGSISRYRVRDGRWWAESIRRGNPRTSRTIRRVPDSTHTMHFHSSSPKSLIEAAFFLYGFQRTASGSPCVRIASMRLPDALSAMSTVVGTSRAIKSTSSSPNRANTPLGLVKSPASARSWSMYFTSLALRRTSTDSGATRKYEWSARVMGGSGSFSPVFVTTRLSLSPWSSSPMSTTYRRQKRESEKSASKALSTSFSVSSSVSFVSLTSSVLHVDNRAKP